MSFRRVTKRVFEAGGWGPRIVSETLSCGHVCRPPRRRRREIRYRRWCQRCAVKRGRDPKHHSVAKAQDILPFWNKNDYLNEGWL